MKKPNQFIFRLPTSSIVTFDFLYNVAFAASQLLPNVNADALFLYDSVKHQSTPLFEKDEMRKLSESVVKHINEPFILYDSCPCTVLYDYAHPGWIYRRSYKLYETFCITTDNTWRDEGGE